MDGALASPLWTYTPDLFPDMERTAVILCASMEQPGLMPPVLDQPG